ncbi:hypothetical protein DIPPA_08820 [Diplonema papillatum]|nr:hypothetical protein DIPPA_08820 [Diplonema papillatum]
MGFSEAVAHFRKKMPNTPHSDPILSGGFSSAYTYAFTQDEDDSADVGCTSKLASRQSITAGFVSAIVAFSCLNVMGSSAGTWDITVGFFLLVLAVYMTEHLPYPPMPLFYFGPLLSLAVLGGFFVHHALLM